MNETFWESRLPGWLFVAGLILLAQWLTSTGIVTSPNLPEPLRIAERLVAEIWSGTLPAEMLSTLRLMVLGYALGATAGVTVGLLMGEFRPIYSTLEPIVELLRPIPVSALVPLLILFLGIFDPLKIATIVLVSFFPILINTYSGVRAIAPTMRETGITFGLGRAKCMFQIIIPSAAPAIFIGLRLAVAMSLIATVFAEMLAGNSGIGYYLIVAQQGLNIVNLYCGIVALAAVGYGLNRGFLALENWLLPWRFGSKERN